MENEQKEPETRKGFHPVANLFPLMEGPEFEALVADIKERGLLHPIVLYEDMILDGRNRYNACLEAGVEPKFEEYDGNAPVSFVVSKNVKRRHLTQSQLGTIGVEVEALHAVYAKERQREHAGTAPGRKKNTGGTNATSVNRKAREKAASELGVSPRYIQDAKKLKKDSPGLFDEVKAGKKTITKAKRELKEREREEHRKKNRLIIENAPTIQQALQNAKFTTIVIDPPWKYSDWEDHDQFGRSAPIYATMNIEELERMPIGEYADFDSHLYLWTTNRSMPNAFRLLKHWGFRYITCLTWCKPSIGMGTYYRGSTEHILFGVKGSLPLKRNNVGTWFEAKRGGPHSAKPDEFYQLVESCSPGPYLDVFGRKQRDGWVVWGEAGLLVKAA